MLIFRLVGILYLLSGLWCAIKPELASQFLSFNFTHASGKAEFVSVYGGLQFGIAIAFLASSFMPIYRVGASFFALMLSIGLFVFRFISIILIDHSIHLIFMFFVEGTIVALLALVWRQQVRIQGQSYSY